MFEHIVSFAIGASLFFFVGGMVEETNREDRIKAASTEFIAEGYIKAYTDQLGKDIGVPMAKCKLSGGEPMVSGDRVACVKEMKDD